MAIELFSFATIDVEISLPNEEKRGGVKRVSIDVIGNDSVAVLAGVRFVFGYNLKHRQFRPLKTHGMDSSTKGAWEEIVRDWLEQQKEFVHGRIQDAIDKLREIRQEKGSFEIQNVPQMVLVSNNRGQ